MRIDADAHRIADEAGRILQYGKLITTVPLNQLIGMSHGVVDASCVDALLFSSVHVVGIGLEGTPPEHLRTKCWMYFPETQSPYHRVTVFSNYSPHNVARPGEQWSLMTEVSQSPAKPVDRGALEEDVISAAVADRLVPSRDRICTTVVRFLPQAYPTPFLGRDSCVEPLLRGFEDRDTYSRGRFGAWKYEVGNEDHSFAQGYECVNRLLADGGAEHEPTLHSPILVNSRRNP
jgi:protoporphyrinogen oxidase